MLPNSARPPMSMLKATMSPSAPAPPLKDTDFASFGLPDESNKLPSAPAQRKMSTSNTSPEGPAQPDAQSGDEKSGDPSKAPALALPVSTPSAPQRLGLSHRSSHSHDFGPIGSPPRSLSSQTIHLNGYSPGSSPAVPISSSPFSAPGSQSVFEPGSLLDFKARSGLAASLGATRTWKTDLGPVPSQVKNRGEGIGAIRGLEREILAEDEDLEEFLPSSLTDLLTPEERSRRMSRTGSAHPGNLNNATLTPRSIAEGPHHRYSRSVPAPSLLGDIKSIWADQNGLPGSPDTGAGLGNVGLGGGLGGGTPNSFKSNSGFGGRSFGFEDTPSPSLLSPSNASAAFLPGLHHHYLNSKMGPQRSTSGGNRTGGPALYPPNSGVATPQNTSTSNLTSSNPAGAAFQQSKVGSLGNRAPYDNFTSDSYSSPLGLHRQISGRPIPGGSGVFGAEGDERHSTISPSTRALQAHAPGQSLPQGLAAGYSRIHALPPPMIASPSAFGSSQNSAYSPGTNPDWTSVSTEQLSTSQNNGTPMTTSANGLETMFSRLSYSAAASRTTTQGMSTTAGLPQSPPKSSPLGMSRGNNRNWQGQGPLSPLSGPVVTGDDDDLFSMDG
ncbi:hypothetical protein SERLA73DRAFT_175237 [Serpula lacrymans var. lacrymans S7.3]|uniref:Uncharacterized protein n=2 Tax=Serpula lacrymans var. lacrymans TaxID=341189 RepID=F8PIN9_SERL3|nr:uncharacterized protein SERLADRAFT_457398 [Serpula lacrymans var. lacrymans S7.9]EGO03672.1 hypothetical protein SERLA73DRAFT_175237 [Serpula lacrymans var. lacrymans S7.3]EGO29535.1 hypothetical protein SERLADRAFT_457398 [Serpula lacrymans var. lacrymans S7.9]